MNVAATFPPFWGLFEPTSKAHSKDAQSLKERFEETEKSLRRSVFYSGSAQSASAELLALADKAKIDDWDGEGGSKISLDSLALALRMLRKMPLNWAAPEVNIDGDGAVSLQWFGVSSETLSVSIGGNRKLSYAWLTSNSQGGIERNYGVAESEGAFPTTISEIVSKYYS